MRFPHPSFPEDAADLQGFIESPEARAARGKIALQFVALATVVLVAVTILALPIAVPWQVTPTLWQWTLVSSFCGAVVLMVLVFMAGLTRSGRHYGIGAQVRGIAATWFALMSASFLLGLFGLVLIATPGTAGTPGEPGGVLLDSALGMAMPLVCAAVWTCVAPGVARTHWASTVTGVR